MDKPREWNAILREHAEVTSKLAAAGGVLDQIIAALLECLRGGNRVFVLGNGGSAADAQHIAGELLGRFRMERNAMPVMALTTDTSTLTAIGNDLGFERIFARQIEGLVRAGDIVWILSTSGNSPNVLEAARTAAALGACVLGFSGESGGKLAALCEVIFLAPHRSSDRIQEAHQLAYHYVCERVEAALA